MYPEHAAKVMGLLEGMAGLGLLIGPPLGSAMYVLAGFIGPFFFLGGLSLVITFLIFPCISSSVESKDEVDEDGGQSNQLTYSKMIKNRFILFAMLSTMFNLYQFTFIEPFFADFLSKAHNIPESWMGVIFFIAGLGYFISCQTVHKALKYISNRRSIITAFLFSGLATSFYGPSALYHIGLNLPVTMAALFVGGLASAYTLLPTMIETINKATEMIEGPVTDRQKDRINDLASGMFNCFFSIGNIIGPLVGNYLYVRKGFS